MEDAHISDERAAGVGAADLDRSLEVKSQAAEVEVQRKLLNMRTKSLESESLSHTVFSLFINIIYRCLKIDSNKRPGLGLETKDGSREWRRELR
jgi:hypothetical protein